MVAGTFGVLLFATLLGALTSTGHAAGSLPPGPAHVTAVEGLRLRDGPGTEYEKLAVMPHLSPVRITGTPENDFYPVRFGDLSGWAHGEHLASDVRVEVREACPLGRAYVTPRDGLRLRAGPSVNARKIMVMPFGSHVRILGRAESGFCPVRHAGVQGWAFSAYLSLTPPDESRLPDTRRIKRIVRRVLTEHGLAKLWPEAERIVGCESGWNPRAIGHGANGDTYRGLWQISDIAWGHLWKRFGLQWDDPADNTALAITIYRWGGDSLEPWGCH